MVQKADFSSLDKNQLKRISRQLEADMHDKELNETSTLRNRNTGFLERRLERQLEAFKRNATYGQSDEDGNAPDSSREKFIASAGTPAKALSTAQLGITEALLLTSGFENDILKDGVLTAEADAARKALAEQLEAGKTVLGIRGDFQQAAAAEQTAAQAKIHLTHEGHLETGNLGIKAMGFIKEADFTQVYGDLIQIQEGKHYYKITAEMAENPAYRAEIIGSVIQSSDLREQVAEWVESDNPEQIQMAQAVLVLNGHENVNISGAINRETLTAAKDYIETPPSLDKVFARFDGKYNGYATEQSIKHGSMTIPDADQVPDTMPELKQLAEDFAGMEPAEYAADFADFLADPEMREQYSQFLETKHTADLTEKYSADLNSKIAELETDAETKQRLETERRADIMSGKIEIDNRSSLSDVTDANRHVHGYMKEFNDDDVGHTAAEVYDKIDVRELWGDREAPRDLTQLVKIKGRVIQADEALADPSQKVLMPDVVQLKSQISHGISEFQKLVGKMSPTQLEHVNGYLDAKQAQTPKTPAADAAASNKGGLASQFKAPSSGESSTADNQTDHNVKPTPTIAVENNPIGLP